MELRERVLGHVSNYWCGLCGIETSLFTSLHVSLSLRKFNGKLFFIQLSTFCTIVFNLSPFLRLPKKSFNSWVIEFEVKAVYFEDNKLRGRKRARFYPKESRYSINFYMFLIGRGLNYSLQYVSLA